MERLTLAPLSDFDLGALFAAIVALLAYRARALTIGGAFAALITGAAIYGSGTWAYSAVLLAFFVSSTLLSRWGRARKARMSDTGKHGPRDGTQVFANGGIAALCAVVAWHAGGGGPWAAAFAGALAAATADTWATEIGTLYGGTPRSVLSGRPLAPGLSGGVSLWGSAAAAAGALAIALICGALAIAPWLPVFAAGVAGAFVDSILGASVQTLRWCPQCRRHCETEPHACGANTTVVRGFDIISNDAVNLLATLAGAGTASLLFTVRFF